MVRNERERKNDNNGVRVGNAHNGATRRVLPFPAGPTIDFLVNAAAAPAMANFLAALQAVLVPAHDGGARAVPDRGRPVTAADLFPGHCEATLDFAVGVGGDAEEVAPEVACA